MYKFSKVSKTTIKAGYNINHAVIKDIKVTITGAIYKVIKDLFGPHPAFNKMTPSKFLMVKTQVL